jgi:lipoprotein-releasing system permease protein
MYKLLLCWRYLLTRYLALACIISVMLGVATLIVVNSVMSGFSTKLKQRLHGLLSDVVIMSYVHDGFGAPQEQMRRINASSIGNKIKDMTATIEVLGLLQMRLNGQWAAPRPVHVIGIDPKSRARLPGFKEFLVGQKDAAEPSFELSDDARRNHALSYPPLPQPPAQAMAAVPGQPPPPQFEVLPEQTPVGIIVGYSLAHMRFKNNEGKVEELQALKPGDEVIIHTISGGGEKLTPVYSSAVVADYFKSEMSEYDSNYIFVPLDWLQHLRVMENRATSIQMMLNDYDDAKEVVDALAVMFPPAYGYKVETWEEMQGPLLAAIGIEKGILNVLLFMIIGVAGFGILAIFAMIVVEKTRDIGILKALGASNGGVMNIFLGYGLLLGVIGALLGTNLGVFFTININKIEHWLTRHTGHEIFPRDVYYFDRIPTDIQAWSVLLVNVGAVTISVLASVLPALRAALLQPVRALRYE